MMTTTKTREVGFPGFGPFCLPAEPLERSRHAETCVRSVLSGEYSYPRDEPEHVRTLVDVGCNLGAFIRWAVQWWPTIDAIHAYDPNGAAIEVAQRNIETLRFPLFLYRAAVTVDPAPLFNEGIDWGGSRTYGQVEGVRVRAVHPSELPPCDALKIDAEGVELEVLSHYRHLAGVKVLAFEYHETRFRKPMMALAEAAGLVMRRGNTNPVEVDTQVWVRP